VGPLRSSRRRSTRPPRLLEPAGNHEDVGRRNVECSVRRATREWRAHWRAALRSISSPLQIDTSASSLRIRVRRFDSSRGHRLSSCGIACLVRVCSRSRQRAPISESRPRDGAASPSTPDRRRRSSQRRRASGWDRSSAACFPPGGRLAEPQAPPGVLVPAGGLVDSLHVSSPRG
jgi:hypothetical protein